jgi:hypothetical protein
MSEPTPPKLAKLELLGRPHVLDHRPPEPPAPQVRKTADGREIVVFRLEDRVAHVRAGIIESLGLGDYFAWLETEESSSHSHRGILFGRFAEHVADATGNLMERSARRPPNAGHRLRVFIRTGRRDAARHLRLYVRCGPLPDAIGRLDASGSYVQTGAVPFPPGLAVEFRVVARTLTAAFVHTLQPERPWVDVEVILAPVLVDDNLWAWDFDLEGPEGIPWFFAAAAAYLV